MANHLRSLIDASRSGLFTVANHSHEQWWDRAPEFVLRFADQAVCFDAGCQENMVGLKIVPDLDRLPYPITWIEFAASQCVVGALLIEENKQLGGHVWIMHGGTWRFAFPFKCQIDGKIGFQCVTEDMADDANVIVANIRVFLSALACTNVRRVEHNPDTKLQKARAKRGKQPLFSYWTLELDLSRAESSDSLGGTHASPRLHLRRGHARQYAPGKWTWVQPCVVGNKAAGMVHKDYLVSA